MPPVHPPKVERSVPRDAYDEGISMGAKTATFADPAPDHPTHRVFIRCLYTGGPVRAHCTRPETGTLLGERLLHPDFNPLLKLDGERLACAGWWVGYVDEQGAWRLAGSGRLVATQPEVTQ